ncbi:MAG TPA: glucoamylase family protein, partial [Azonexus sp.]|nr:glucoamylase family protein [Azonexus sp.]
SFIGKGIYDVDAFELALGGRFPENRILSHDLLEGCYARAGLLSDVQLFEDYPARYSADVSRRYRWIRGDWQLAGWLRRRVPCACSGEAVRHQRNPLSALSQWKLLDNLRRSLVPAALMLVLLLGWALMPAAVLWTAAVIGILLIPALCAAGLDLARKPGEVLFRQHLAAVADSVFRHGKQVAFELACLPYTAYFSLDAIARTLWRMLVTGKPMLEWNPSSDVDRELARRDRSGLAASFRSMWSGPLMATAAGLYLAAARPETLAAAGAVLLLWLGSPGIAWWISRPLVRRPATLSSEQGFFLRHLARRTWAFFDNFVGADDHWLPPDNFQEYRIASVAHRTSPTNMGLGLLANLAAYDFGYLTAGRLLERTAQTLNTMAGLEQHRGHFYNWYDTQTLQPMAPLYVSTVDSGNLAGHLLTLRAGLCGLADEKILPPRLYAGLRDTLGVLAETAEAGAKGTLAAFAKLLDAAATAPPATLGAARLTLQHLANNAADVGIEIAASLATRDPSLPASEANDWAQALAGQINEALAELDHFASDPATDALPTLRHLAGEGNAFAAGRLELIEDLARQAGQLADMEYGFLFDKGRQLLTIGYNVVEHRTDTSYYDLLASEARLCSFVAIAQGQVPQESWFSLGRLLTGTGGEPALLSWSGSMFEYLMPMLVMPSYDNTLLDQTCKAAVARQIEYGSQRSVPWGISESGYNTVDVHLNYQYRAFGVPGLGLKRGLAEDLVVAPYASALALMVAPEAACQNLQRLAGEGALGKFGFFEAIDYTPARQRRGQSKVVVHSYMAHHQGMSLLGLAYLLLDRPMQRRFAAERRF